LSRIAFFAWKITAFLVCLAAVSAVFSSTAPAFYTRQGENGQIDVRGFLQLAGALTKNPSDDSFYAHDSDATGAALGRLIILADRGDHFGFEFNGYQTYTSTTGTLSPLQGPFQGSGAALPERSAALEWTQLDDSDREARMGVDRLSVRLSYERTDLSLGRQPVNLATTIYFTPNDFFAPFAPQAFFRVYKPGVDAVRAEIRLGELSQLSLIDVIGYEPDPSTGTGWSRTPEIDRSSVLARISFPGLGFEWAALGGRVHDRSLAGLSFQGEWAGWLGIRAEGNYARSGVDGGDGVAAAVDFEHRFPNSLMVRLEPFYNSRGYDSISDFPTLDPVNPSLPSFRARYYTTLGLEYEFSPLLNGEMVSIANWVDPSYLFSFNAVYSLADEAELSMVASWPAGSPPENGEVRSEFGLLPYWLSAELRIYF
jgi:hypothetical protein